MLALASVASLEVVEDGDLIVEEAGGGSDFFIIQEGELAATRETPVGCQTVAVLKAGDLFGEISLLDSMPRSSTVKATGRAQIWRFDAFGIAELVLGWPHMEKTFLQTFWRSLSSKIRAANMAMAEIMAPGTKVGIVGDGTSDAGKAAEVDADDKKAILTSQNLSAEDLDVFAVYLEPVRYTGGDMIFAEGDKGDALYIVVDGEVRISRNIGGMGEEALAILGPGEIFGEMSLIDKSPRSANAIAHQGSATMLMLDRTRLDEVMGSESAAATQFLRLLCSYLCRRIRIMNDQLVAWSTIAFFSG